MCRGKAARRTFSDSRYRCRCRLPFLHWDFLLLRVVVCRWSSVSWSCFLAAACMCFTSGSEFGISMHSKGTCRISCCARSCVLGVAIWILQLSASSLSPCPRAWYSCLESPLRPDDYRQTVYLLVLVALDSTHCSRVLGLVFLTHLLCLVEDLLVGDGLQCGDPLNPRVVIVR